MLRVGSIRKKKPPKPAIRTFETTPEETLQGPSSVLQAPLQGEQQIVNTSDAHQPLPEDISSRELLSQARRHIKTAQQSVLAASQPFASRGNIIPSHFENAARLLNVTIEHMQELLKLFPKILSCPSEPVLARFFASYWEIEVEIYRVKDEAESFIEYLLQKGGDVNRRDVTQKAARIETILNRLPWYFDDNELPPSG